MKGKMAFLTLYLFSCASYGGADQWMETNAAGPFDPQNEVVMSSLKKMVIAALPLEDEVQETLKKKSSQKTTPMPAPKEGLKKSTPNDRNVTDKAAQTKNKSGKQKDAKKIMTQQDVKKPQSTTLSKEKHKAKPVAKNAQTKPKAVRPVKATGSKAMPQKKSAAGNTKKTAAKQEMVKGGKDPEKCGLFRDFVEQYTIKTKDECPGAACDVYKRQLEKYKAKAKRYC